MIGFQLQRSLPRAHGIVAATESRPRQAQLRVHFGLGRSALEGQLQHFDGLREAL